MKKVNLHGGRKTVGSFRSLTIAAFLMLGVIGAFVGLKDNSAEASTPPSGTVSATSGSSAAWMGDKTGIPPAANGEPSCSDGTANSTNCDTFTLTVSPGDWAQKQVRVRISPSTAGDDYDLVVRRETNGKPGMQGDGAGAVVPGQTEFKDLDAIAATSGNAAGSAEEIVLDPPNSGAIYYVRTIYFAAVSVTVLQYQGTAEVISTASETLTEGTCALPTYDNYQPPVGYPQRDNSGEPSIGSNLNSGNIMSMSRLRGNRTTFNDSTSPADPISGVSWFSNTSPAIRTGLDPILFTDPATGRTIGGELSGNFTNGFISDDDLSTITASFQAATSKSSVDHQTIGGGPPKRDPSNAAIVARQPRTNYPNLFYYAAQNIGYADVATSFDGGLTYDQAIPAYTLAQCNGLHGHIKVAPDGTVYLPNKNCGGKAAVVVSEDNGLTWSVRKIPTSSAGDNDPSVGIGSGGRIYVGYTASDKRPRVAVSDDKGLNWRDDFNLALGVSPNITASVFPAAVAGDNNRAAIFFLATDSTMPGDPTGTDGEDTAAGVTSDDFKGTWFPYIATTCDGGKSWSVVRADNDPLYKDTQNNPLPNPVQQGVVCTNGTTCPTGTRNLLDFNDVAVDSRGRVVAVYADGCNTNHPCISVPKNTGTRTSNQGIARLTLIRQRGGVRLFSAFDTGGPAAPKLSPPTQIQTTKRDTTLLWATPDDNGSPLIAYRIYRGQVRGGEQLIAEVGADQYKFVDQLRKGGSVKGVYYHVTTVNAHGESPRGAKIFPVRGE